MFNLKNRYVGPHPDHSDISNDPEWVYANSPEHDVNFFFIGKINIPKTFLIVYQHSSSLDFLQCVDKLFMINVLRILLTWK